MKKIIFSIFSCIFVFIFNSLIFADGWVQNGGMYYYQQNGDYVKNQFVNTMDGSYYLDQNGIMVSNNWIDFQDGRIYYAKDDGRIATNGISKINGNAYYFDREGLLQKGWIDDLYYANDNGFLVTGFQELSIPKTWYTENSKQTEGWFYFDNNYKKVYSENNPYKTKMIGDDIYCFDTNGILRTGWRMIKETEPAMKGYMYFSENETKDFKFAAAVKNSWFANELPTEVVNGSDVHYFYFTGSGYLHCANVGLYSKYRVNEKTYLFNQYGYAVYGIRKVGNDYYFFGSSNTDCSMKTGKLTLTDNAGNTNEYYFNEKGVGYTGVYKNKLYYKGLLQKADAHSKYVAYMIESKPILVNTAGLVQKNKRKIKDGDGCQWTTSETGMVTYTDEGNIEQPEAPYLTED